MADRHDDFPAHKDEVRAMFAVAMEEHSVTGPDGGWSSVWCTEDRTT
ncbi:MAG: hypothetical protein ACP5IL_16860 [Syntrophobacteraceae bacterium]